MDRKKRFLERAEELRTLAEGMKNDEPKTMLRLAKSYEEMARREHDDTPPRPKK